MIPNYVHYIRLQQPELRWILHFNVQPDFWHNFHCSDFLRQFAWSRPSWCKDLKSFLSTLTRGLQLEGGKICSNWKVERWWIWQKGQSNGEFKFLLNYTRDFYLISPQFNFQIASGHYCEPDEAVWWRTGPEMEFSRTDRLGNLKSITYLHSPL